MDFFRKSSKKKETASPGTAGEIHSRIHKPQLEVPPKAYTQARGWYSSLGSSDCEPLLRENRSQPVDSLGIDILQSDQTLPWEPLDDPSRSQERGCHMNFVNLEEENERLRMENTQLKTDLEEEHEKYTTALEYWAEAEKEFEGLLRVCQTKDQKRQGNSDSYERDNDIEEAKTSVESKE